MKERPILFSALMVRAILAGTKTQTRRVVKPHRSDDSFVLEDHGNGWWPYRSEDGESGVMSDGCEHRFKCPYGRPGDRLWVRETFYYDQEDAELLYRADGEFDGEQVDSGYKWQPSIHMPRWASHITLEITGVRVERLQDISESDIWAEGWRTIADIPDENGGRCKYRSFGQFWESINGPRSWYRNPWVWVVEFRRVEK